MPSWVFVSVIDLLWGKHKTCINKSTQISNRENYWDIQIWLGYRSVDDISKMGTNRFLTSKSYGTSKPFSGKGYNFNRLVANQFERFNITFIPFNFLINLGVGGGDKVKMLSVAQIQYYLFSTISTT